MALTQASEGGLKISNAGTNGQYLQKQSGNTGGLTWADVSSIGGAAGADFNDDVKIRLGTGNDLELYHDGTNSYINNNTGDLVIKAAFPVIKGANDETILTAGQNGAIELYWDNAKKFETTSTGVTVTGDITISDKIIHAGDTNTAIRFPAADTITFETGGSERLRIDSSGRLLYGVTSSISGVGFQFVNTYNQFYGVGDNSAGTALDLLKTRNTAPGSYTVLQDGDCIGEIKFRGSASDQYVNGAMIKAVINGTPGSGNDLPTDIQFHTMPDGVGSTNERMRILSNGQVTIGTSTPNAYTDRALSIYNSGSCYLEVRTDAGDNNSGIVFSKGTAQNSDSYRGHIAYNHTDNAMRFYVNGGTEELRIQSGGGISFNGDTAAANALEDYEEGSFTVTDLSGASLTFTSQANRYTKVGRVVHIMVNITFPTTSNSSAMKFGGVPYAIEGGTTSSGIVSLAGGYANGVQIHMDSAGMHATYDGSLAIGGFSNNQFSAKQVCFALTYST